MTITAQELAEKRIDWYESRDRGYANRLQPGTSDDDGSATAVGSAVGAATTSATTIYTVKDGDNLTRIASNYPGVSYIDIAEANNIPDPYVIQPGQNLTIPAASN